MPQRSILRRIKSELTLYKNLLADARTPRSTKILLGLAVAYTLSPIDLIPDFIPILGQLDDLIIVPSLVYLALRTIPKKLVEEHRGRLRKPNVASGQTNNQ